MALLALAITGVVSPDNSTGGDMKTVIAIAFCIPALAQAGAGLPCKQYEYAELKDSSKAELTDIYCAASRRDKSNTELLRDMQAGALDMASKGLDSSRLHPSMAGILSDIQACQVTSNAAWGMLEKKYKIKQPSCK